MQNRQNRESKRCGSGSNMYFCLCKLSTLICSQNSALLQIYLTKLFLILIASSAPAGSWRFFLQYSHMMSKSSVVDGLDILTVLLSDMLQIRKKNKLLGYPITQTYSMSPEIQWAQASSRHRPIYHCHRSWTHRP